MPISKEFWDGTEAAVVLNQTLAERSRSAKGDTIFLHVQKADNVPREYLLGKRRQQDVVEAIKSRSPTSCPTTAWPASR